MLSPTDSLFSDYSSDHPFSFGGDTTVVGGNASWCQEPVSPSDELPLLSKRPWCGPSKRTSVPPTVHSRSLPAGADSVPLLAVNLHSWAPSPTSLPSFTEGQYISGQVQLNLKTPDRVKSVSVSLEGYYSIPGHEAKTFSQVSDTLWDCTMGDPRSTGLLMSQDADPTGRLHGKYSWSFKFEFPTTLEVSGKEEKRLGIRNGERLPPSLRGGHGQPRIGYEIVVRIKRSGLRSGNSLTIPITYMISTQPYPVSLPRQPAYQDAPSAPIHFDNPSEWKVFPGLQVNGSFNRSQTSFTCTFALASPLSYVRGSFIPCTLVVSSHDHQVLIGVTNPSAPQVMLRRRLVLYSKLGGELPLEGQETVIGKASWMPVREVVQTHFGFTRVLQGEIELPLAALPSFTFGRLEMKYDVLVFPFECPEFFRNSSGPLLAANVFVATSEGSS